jgi:hypothetical protein
MSRIAPTTFPKHAAAVMYVSDLILDLKLQSIGRPPHDPITFERLDEWTRKYAHDLLACREPAIRR